MFKKEIKIMQLINKCIDLNLDFKVLYRLI